MILVLEPRPEVLAELQARKSSKRKGGQAATEGEEGGLDEEHLGTDLEEQMMGQREEEGSSDVVDEFAEEAEESTPT